MKHDFFERIFLAFGLLIFIYVIISTLVFFPALFGDTGKAFLNTYVDMGVIKIQTKFLYIAIAFIGWGLIWFIGKGIDKFILHTWGEETYEAILAIAFIIVAIIFVIIGALIGWYMFQEIILKIIAAIIGAVMGFVLAYKVVTGSEM